MSLGFLFKTPGSGKGVEAFQCVLALQGEKALEYCLGLRESGGSGDRCF